jgi:glyoxylase I family protein
VILTGLHHLGLTVTDADASATWYETVLGFRRDGGYESADGGRRKVFLSHQRLGVRLGLCQHRSSAADRFDETRPGLDHLSFLVDSVEELRAWQARLTAADVVASAIAEANTIPGAFVLVFRDPDNIQLEMYAPGQPA